MRVFVTGASGFIGRRLIRELIRRGDRVVALTRNRHNLRSSDSERLTVVEGDPTRAGEWQQQLAGCDAVIALAGEPILGQRWNDAFKRRLVDSRVESLKRLYEALAALPEETRPKILASASAIGIYGSRGDEVLDETTQSGAGFTAQLCSDWESGAKALTALGLRVSVLRIGIVLGDGGGVLERMVPAFRAFVGGPIGSGQQYVAWIHLDDIVGIFLMALDEPSVSGVLNLTAPTPVRMRDFAATIGKVLHRPSMVAVPELALKVLLGEGASVVLASQRVLPRRTQELGYRFRFPDLQAALTATLETQK